MISLVLVVLHGFALYLRRPTDFNPPDDVKVKIEFLVFSETNFSDSSFTGGAEVDCSGRIDFSSTFLKRLRGFAHFRLLQR